MIAEIISTLALFIALAFINVSVIYIYRRKIKWFFNEVYNKALKRSTPLQKEIKAERKEIEKLKQHKRDMEELEELKKQKDRLWEDVHEEERPTFKGIDPLPHLKNIQRNEFSADDIRYIALKKQSEHFEEIIREVEEFKKRHTKDLTRCPDCGEVAMADYPEVAIGENNWRYLYYCNNCPAKY